MGSRHSRWMTETTGDQWWNSQGGRACLEGKSSSIEIVYEQCGLGFYRTVINSKVIWIWKKSCTLAYMHAMHRISTQINVHKQKQKKKENETKYTSARIHKQKTNEKKTYNDIHTRMHALTHTRTNACPHAGIHIHTDAHRQTHVRVNDYSCMRVCVCVVHVCVSSFFLCQGLLSQTKVLIEGGL